MAGSDHILELQGVCKNFGAVEATREVSLEVTKGTIHALIGPNGAGKTTLVNQITGDMLPDSGTIRYKSHDVTRLRAYQRSRLGIGRSFQITHIFENLTVAENLAIAICAASGHNFRFWRNGLKSRRVIKKLTTSIARVDLADKSAIPAKFLSHGEKRQLEVGMALAVEPELLILDEPMAGMGPGGTVELSKLISKLKKSVTILLVEHDMEVVFALADMETVLVYGENILTAPPEIVKTNEQVKAAYLGEDG